MFFILQSDRNNHVIWRTFIEVFWQERRIGKLVDNLVLSFVVEVTESFLSITLAFIVLLYLPLVKFVCYLCR